VCGRDPAKDWGEAHLREVLLSIVERAGNDRSLTAPVIWAVSDPVVWQRLA